MPECNQKRFVGMLWEANNAAANKRARNLGKDDLAEEVSGGADDVCNLMRLWIMPNS